MDNSKVLKPIVGPQESSESKKKESNKKKKALIVSALAFLIATGTIATSIAVVKANMPKLLIKFDQWFVDSFDKESIQHFIDDNRLSEQSMFKQLPGYVDKKAKDQNVKNADAIYTAKFTDKVPNDKSNKFPPGVYIELTAEDEYSFEYQADLSLEENKEETKQLSKLTKDEEKQTKYFISSDKSKLYILVYERPIDNDITNEVEDLQTFNDYEITNIPDAFESINKYINQKPRRYTQNEFASEFDYDVSENKSPASLEIFYEKLIGLQRKYVLNNPKPTYDKTTDTVTIYLNNQRSNFNFVIPSNYESKVKYDNSTGILTLTGFEFYNLTQIKLDTLFDDLQDYIKEQSRRYTKDEFRDQMGSDDLRNLILKSVDPENNETQTPKPLDETVTDPNNPENGDGETEGGEPETPQQPEIGKPKINNLFMRGNDLVIEFQCDPKYKYQDIYVNEENKDDTKYSFDTQTDSLTVKGLRYFTEYTISNTSQAFHNLDQEIIKIPNQYTVEQFKAYIEGETSKEECKQLIASALTTDKGAFNKDWITNLSLEQDTQITAKLKIEFDTDFKKYKTNNNEQYPVDSETSSMEIKLTFFKEVELNNLQKEIQGFIDVDTGERYTLTEFRDEINAPSTTSKNLLQQQISDLVEASIQDSKDVRDFKYIEDSNELKFTVTISKYDKFPTNGTDISYILLNKNDDGTANYEVTITNLQYWFDFEILDKELLKTKKEVEEYITNNGVSSSDDEDENTYPEHKNSIFNIFGKTPLKNGRKLSEFMTNSEVDFKLTSHSNFNINLKPKLDQEKRMRKFYPVENLTSDGIELMESNKMLKFNNLEFSIGDKYFVVNKKDKIIYGVSDLGLKSKVLTTPKGYSKIHPSLNEIDIGNGKKEKSWAFSELNVLHTFNMNNDVIEIKELKSDTGFLQKSPNLSIVNMSSNIKEIKINRYLLYWVPKLKNFNFKKGFNYVDTINSSSFVAGIDKILLPRNVKSIGLSSFYRMNSNVKPDGESYFIGWCDLFSGYYMLKDYKYMKGVCLLADNLKQNPNWKNPFDEFLKVNSTVKFYVKSENVKNQLYSYYTVKKEKIEVRSDLENELITAGKIPADW